MSAEMERHEGDPGIDTLRDHRLDLEDLAEPSGPVTQTVGAIPDIRILLASRVLDFDEHLLLQFRQPGIGARFIAAAFVFDQPARWSE